MAPIGRATVAALLGAGLSTASLAAPAALPVDGSAAVAAPTADVPIVLEWDGTVPATGTTAFLGAPITVPGDSATRTVTVHNGGPTAGRLRASIVNVTLLEPGAPEAAPAFYDDLTVTWDAGQDTGAASFTELAAGGTTTIGELAVPHGGSARLTIGYAFPADATSGNRAEVARRAASFDLLLELGADLAAEPPTPGPSTPGPSAPEPPTTEPSATEPPTTATPTPQPPPSPGPDAPEPVGTDVPDGSLPTSGAPVRVVVGGALAVLATGLVLLAVVRRRTVQAEDGGAAPEVE